MKFLRILFILQITFLTAFSQDSVPQLKIAVVDVTTVFKAHPATATAEAVLEKSRKEGRELFKEKAEALKDVLQKHQAVTQKMVHAGSSVSSADKESAKSLLDQAMKLEKEIATLKTTNESDLKTGFINERSKILKNIAEIIAEFNSDGRYALVFDKSASSANGIPQIMHAPGAVDITGQITALVKQKNK